MLPQPGTIFGLALLAAGGLGLYGSITGNLAPMIAALFYPSLIEGTQSAQGQKKPGINPFTGKPWNASNIGGGGTTLPIIPKAPGIGGIKLPFGF